MNCQLCGEHPARIHYTEHRDGKEQKLKICEDCAESLGFGGEHDPALAAEITLAVEDDEPAPDARRCRTCGMTAAQLRKTSQFGCADCYEVFAEILDPMLERLHGATRHRGRLPGGRVAEPIDVGRLEAELHQAVRSEDFEKAARLRDALRRAGGVVPEEEE